MDELRKFATPFLAAIAVAMLVLFLVTLATNALAQGQQGGGAMCVDREKGVAFLESEHGETVVMRGINHEGWMVELYMNAETGSWSYTSTPPTDTTMICLLDSGSAMQETEAEKPSNPS